LCHWPGALAVIGRLGAAGTNSQCQPSEGDLPGAWAARLVAVLSARSAGRSHRPCQEGRRPSPPSHRRSRSGHGRVDPTARSTSPRPPTTSAATWPRRGSRPRRGRSGVAGPGPRTWPGGSVRVEGTGGSGPGWLACWVRRPGGGGGQPAGRQARRRPGRSDPVDAEAAARAVLAGQATAIPRPVTAWARWCGAWGWPGPRR
jgi:hypothetical protein